MDAHLEVVVIPVSDVDRAKAFHSRLGWRLDADVSGDEYRLVQFTPPGSACSIQFGSSLTPAPPRSAHGLLLSVADVEGQNDRADYRFYGSDRLAVSQDGSGSRP